ncbi:MAG: hypothetical protein IPJ65_11850 [Archangiaceae bacterium]|nr:hypothetical protein [Archangiaceae bacterium]
MRVPFTALVLLLGSATAGAVDFSGRARANLGGGIDSNAPRDFVSPDAGALLIDGMVQGIANLAGTLQGERGAITGSYDVGARKFFRLPHEDTVIQTAQLDASLWLPAGFGLGLTGRARDRRGADRDYTDLGAELSVQYVPDGALDFRAWGGLHRFIFWSGFRSSFWAPEGGFTARYKLNKRHSVSVNGLLSSRTFNAKANVRRIEPEPGDVDADKDGVLDSEDACPDEPGSGNGCPRTRSDFFGLASVAYWYRGPVVFSLSYGYLDSSSNSYGESLRQHRVGLIFGAPLFWQLKLLIDINLRFAVYPDGLYVSPEILTLDEGGENLTSGVLKLVRPIGEHFEVEARYGIYYGVLPRNEFVYWRHAVTLSVGAHF